MASPTDELEFNSQKKVELQDVSDTVELSEDYVAQEYLMPSEK